MLSELPESENKDLGFKPESPVPGGRLWKKRAEGAGVESRWACKVLSGEAIISCSGGGSNIPHRNVSRHSYSILIGNFLWERNVPEDMCPLPGMAGMRFLRLEERSCDELAGRILKDPRM